ncbi:MAG: tol-pal system-associated acyl-CoA thioesterase [Gammaproteobacteria bacterium]|nr:tol-pal system-associated acyl-CoA thioesterase [Gammaproteobacteria bacterium]
MTSDERARDGAFIWPVRVYYEDTDSTGLVYHANYLRFMERARTEWMRSHGFELGEVLERYAVLFTVSRLQVEFQKPASFDDRLEVSVEVERLGAASLNLAQRIWRARAELLCRATVRIACVEAGSIRPCAIPKKLMSELKRDRRSITA